MWRDGVEEEEQSGSVWPLEQAGAVPLRVSLTIGPASGSTVRGDGLCPS